MKMWYGPMVSGALKPTLNASPCNTPRSLRQPADFVRADGFHRSSRRNSPLRTSEPRKPDPDAWPPLWQTPRPRTRERDNPALSHRGRCLVQAGLVGMTPPVSRAPDNRHDIDSPRAGKLRANSRQRGFQTIDPGFFGGELPRPRLIHNLVRRIGALRTRRGHADVIHSADVRRAPRIAVRLGVFIGVAVVRESPLPFAFEIAERIHEAAVPPLAGCQQSNQFGTGKRTSGLRHGSRGLRRERRARKKRRHGRNVGTHENHFTICAVNAVQEPSMHTALSTLASDDGVQPSEHPQVRLRIRLMNRAPKH